MAGEMLGMIFIVGEFLNWQTISNNADPTHYITKIFDEELTVGQTFLPGENIVRFEFYSVIRFAM